MKNATVVKLLLLSVLALALTSELVRAETSDITAVDVKAALAEARAAAGASAAPAAEPVAAASMRYERDCASFRFNPDSPLSSERVRLHSREWIEECRYVGDPRRGGYRECWSRPGFSYSETVQVTLRERLPLLPWESDTFRVCLEGPWLDVQAVATAYEYRRVSDRRDGQVVLAPGRKLAMRPDPAGIAIEGLTPALELRLRDRWASYYKGETTVLKLTIKRKKENWFDPVLFEGEIQAPVAEQLILDLTRLAEQFSEKLSPGKSYYVKVSFKRLGTISRPDEVSIGETPAVTYQPGGAPALAGL